MKPELDKKGLPLRFCVTFELSNDYRENPDFWFARIEDALTFIQLATDSKNARFDIKIQDHDSV